MSTADPRFTFSAAPPPIPVVAVGVSARVPNNGDLISVRTERTIRSLRAAGALLILFLGLLALWWVTGPMAAAQTTGGAVQQAVTQSDSPSTAPLLALTGACTALVTALGVVIRAFVKGDIAPRANAVREEELLKQNAVLSRLLEDAAKREDIFYRYIGIHPPTPNEGRD